MYRCSLRFCLTFKDQLRTQLWAAVEKEVKGLGGGGGASSKKDFSRKVQVTCFFLLEPQGEGSGAHRALRQSVVSSVYK